MVARACPSCSVISETEKDFCPECGTSFDRSLTVSTSSPVATRTKSNSAKTLSVIGLVFYVLAWLVPCIFSEYVSWGDMFQAMLGFDAIKNLPDSFEWFPNLFIALMGYILVALVIVTSKKSS
tara:strand:- start:386 stop:754 length:369 start_codon:yes stop_codon:yes gene_type:complete